MSSLTVNSETNFNSNYVATLVCIVLSWLVFKVWKFLINWRIYSKLPQRKSHWFFGNLIEFKQQPNEPGHQTRLRVFKGFYKQFGSQKVALIWRFWKPILVVYSREPFETMITNKTEIAKGTDYDFIRPWIGDGLLLSTGNKWHRRRKLLTPAFHFKILHDFLPSLVQYTNGFIASLDGQSTVDLEKIIPLATLDVICQTAMGISIDAIKNPQSEYVKAVSYVTEAVIVRALRPTVWFDFIYNQTEEGRLFNKSTEILRHFSMDVIMDRIAQVISERNGQQKTDSPKNSGESRGNVYFMGKKKKQAFMDTLIDEYLDKILSGNSSSFTIDDIREEVDTFMFEGHDTTAVSLSWTLYVLGHKPEIQEKLFKEISQHIDKDGSNLDSDVISKLNYLDACVKESLRLYPPVPSIQRRLVDDIELAGYKIPKGTTMAMHIFFLHRDPEIFPNPENYDPNRWINDDLSSNDKPAFAFLPFSGGLRNCVGQKFALMEVKIFISLILLNYQIVSQGRLEDAQMSLEVVLRPKTPLNVKLIKR